MLNAFTIQNIISGRSAVDDGVADDTRVHKGIKGIASEFRTSCGNIRAQDLNTAPSTRTDLVGDCPKQPNTYVHSQGKNKDISVAEDSYVAEEPPSVGVNVKYAKAKYRVELALVYTGKQVFEEFSRVTKVPVTGIKVIHKGKLQTEMSVLGNVAENATFFVIGQMAEDEEGLDTGDIELIMKQLSVERNVAVKALRKTNCLLDAIFEIGNS